MTSQRVFTYKAVQRDGKSRKGVIAAASEAEAYARLRADELSPLQIKPSRVKTQGGGLFAGLARLIPKEAGLSETELEEVCSSLAVLLRAGADIRTALGGVERRLGDAKRGCPGHPRRRQR